MSKSKKETRAPGSAALPKADNKLAATDNSIDPVLASLFASSSGPVTAPPRITTSRKVAPVPRRSEREIDTSSSGDSSSSGDNNDDDDDDSEGSDASPEDSALTTSTRTQATVEKSRKRKRATDGDDLEGAYFKRLQREEDKEHKQKPTGRDGDNEDTSSDEDESPSSASDDDDVSEPSSVEVPPRHEIFDKKLNNDQDRLTRTVFLGNVSTSAIKSTSAKRALTRHLRSVLKTPAHGPRLGKFESIRFRSTAYDAKSGPKKATFAKKELMDTTTTSTNAYAVFTTEAAAEHVAKKLNGSVILDRHLRVDFLAKPLPIEHKRCIFIGNLSFVNEETPPETADNDRRPTAKQPADAEEGLWRTFSKCGPVESVRVVRDQETRISKGFAYVQYKDENAVEAALLLNERKFPPMLPRKLRVMRARKMKIKSTTSAPAAWAAKAGPGGKMPSKSSFARGRRGKPIVFEGHRASEGSGVKKGKPQSLKDRKERQNRKRPDSNSAKRKVNSQRAEARKRRSGEGK